MNSDLRAQVERIRKIRGAATCRKAFSEVLEIYLLATFAQPLSSSAPRDLCFRSAYRKWSPDTAHTVIDVERAIERTLGKGALTLFLKRFAGDHEPALDPPGHLNPEMRKAWNSFKYDCGAAFIHRGLWPLRKWFGLPEREVA